MQSNECIPFRVQQLGWIESFTFHSHWMTHLTFHKTCHSFQLNNLFICKIFQLTFLFSIHKIYSKQWFSSGHVHIFYVIHTKCCSFQIINWQKIKKKNKKKKKKKKCQHPVFYYYMVDFNAIAVLKWIMLFIITFDAIIHARFGVNWNETCKNRGRWSNYQTELLKTVP